MIKVTSRHKSTMYIISFWLFASVFDITYSKSIEIDDGKQPFELNEFLIGAFATKTFNGSWKTDDSFMYNNAAGNLEIFNVNTKTVTLFLERSVLANYSGASVIISPDQLYVLIRYNVSSVFRHSTTALYTVYAVDDKTYHDIAEKKPIQIAKWTPTGHGLAYVLHNNIYYLEDPAANQSPLKVTTTGIDGIIYNGIPDWVYEEEVLGTGLAFWFSPSGTKLAFASFQDEYVQEFQYTIYGNTQYPTDQKIRYPKVGTTNPSVQIFTVDLKQDATPQELPQSQPTSFKDSDDTVFYDLSWINENELALIWSNRVQNEAELLRCTLIASNCNPEAHYKEEKGWLDVKIPKYNKDGTWRLEILSQKEGNDLYSHLVLTDVATKKQTRLTKGAFTVTSISGWDQNNKLIYFFGSGVNAPWQQHVYRVSTESLQMNCLTCNWTAPVKSCSYATATFSKDFSHIAKMCRGPGPDFVLLEKTLNPTESVVWEENVALQSKLASKQLPTVKNLKVPVANGFEANVRLFLPPNLDESGAKKYPAIVNVYGGPDSNQIRDMYSAGLENYLATNREYIYIYIDGRGSGRDGKNKMFEIYRGMGTVEIADQINVTQYLQDTLPYIDRKKTCIWGWSYGGFSTAWALVKDVNNVFKCGLSVAPVTNFQLYDSIYTERYMGLLEENAAGYNRTDVTRHPKAFEGKLFFLIHGNADDNVHYQNSMALAKALELADIQFQQQSYPDENHSLGSVSPHVYHTIDRFWARSFGLPDPVIKHISAKKEK